MQIPYDFGLFAGGHMFIFWIFLLGGVIWLLYSFKSRNQSPPESALEVAKKRYAKGEISKEELDEIVRNL